MAELSDKTENNFQHLLEDERRSYDRFKDILLKYRMLIPHLSTRSETMERKIEMLLGRREESEERAKELRAARKQAAQRSEALAGKRQEMDAAQAEMAKIFKNMLAGKLPEPVTETTDVQSLALLKEQKEKFLSSVADSFAEIEDRIQTLEEKNRRIQEKQINADSRVEKLDARLSMAEKKINLYKGDIKKQLLSLNDHLKNERELKKQYVELIKTLNDIPDISQEASELFVEVLRKTSPDITVMELGKPISADAASQN